MAKYGPDLNLPNAPTQYTNPLLTGDISGQSALAKRLQIGDFTGDLSWLSGLTNPNSGYLQNAVTSANSLLQPQFRDTIQRITNEAANAGSLNSSTFTDALTRAGSDLNSQYQGIVSNAAMQDYTNANKNRLDLFGLGLNTGQQAIGNEFNQSNTTNAFNLENYGNIVAKAIQDNTNLQNYPDLSNLLRGIAGGSGGSKLTTSSGMNTGLGSLFGNNLNNTGYKNSFGEYVPDFNATPGYSSNVPPQESTYYQPISPLYGKSVIPYTQPGSAFLGSNLTFSAPKINNSLFTKN